MESSVIEAFRRRVASDARKVREESDNVRIVSDFMSGDPPSRFHGLFSGIARFERSAAGEVRESREPLPFTLHFGDDYCSCTDGSLQLRVAQLHAPVLHPNVGPGGLVCLGPRFGPGTRLFALLEHLHQICAARVFASDSPWNPAAADFFRRHPERVRALRSEPLWRGAVAARVRVETATGPASKTAAGRGATR